MPAPKRKTTGKAPTKAQADAFYRDTMTKAYGSSYNWGNAIGDPLANPYTRGRATKRNTPKRA